MLSVFEMNIGHSIYGESRDAMPLLDLLGQGNGIKVCAQWFSRARRRNPNAEANLYACAKLAHLMTIVLPLHSIHVMTEDKAADLVAYIFERGVNMEPLQ